MFSYQSATVGLSIVNQSYHAHDRALHWGARRPVDFKVMVLCGYWLPEALLEICACRGYLLACAMFLDHLEQLCALGMTFRILKK